MNIVIEAWVLYLGYQILRIIVINRIKLKWNNINDKRRKKYTNDDMYGFNKNNWYGLKYPREKNYK